MSRLYGTIGALLIFSVSGLASAGALFPNGGERSAVEKARSPNRVPSKSGILIGHFPIDPATLANNTASPITYRLWFTINSDDDVAFIGGSLLKANPMIKRDPKNYPYWIELKSRGRLVFRTGIQDPLIVESESINTRSGVTTSRSARLSDTQFQIKVPAYPESEILIYRRAR